MKLAFLHTAQVHVNTFDRLLAENRLTIEVIHRVMPELLARARADGLTPEIVAAVEAEVGKLAASGAEWIVCTCSTIGDVAEKCEVHIPVWRVDRPMMEAAVQAGSKLLVVATLASTIAPTRDLLTSVAQSLGQPVTILELTCAEAWPFFEAGDMDRYGQSIAAAIQQSEPVDAVILAQASMAVARLYLDELGIPVFSSPETAVQALARVMTNKN